MGGEGIGDKLTMILKPTLIIDEKFIQRARCLANEVMEGMYLSGHNDTILVPWRKDMVWINEGQYIFPVFFDPLPHLVKELIKAQKDGVKTEELEKMIEFLYKRYKEVRVFDVEIGYDFDKTQEPPEISSVFVKNDRGIIFKPVEKYESNWNLLHATVIYYYKTFSYVFPLKSDKGDLLDKNTKHLKLIILYRMPDNKKGKVEFQWNFMTLIESRELVYIQQAEE